MLPDFNNLRELTIRFSDDMVCREYLEQLIWKGNPTCPHCGQNKPYKLKDQKTYRCSNKECKKDFTVTVGTVFEGSNVPLSKWFVAIYLATNHKKGISSIQLSKDISVTQRTAWFMLHRMKTFLYIDKKGVYCGSATEEQLNAFHAMYCGKQTIEKYRQRLSTRSIEQSHDSYIKLGP